MRPSTATEVQSVPDRCSRSNGSSNGSRKEQPGPAAALRYASRGIAGNSSDNSLKIGDRGWLVFSFRNCPRAWARQLPVVFLPFLVVSARYVLRRYSVPSTKAWPRSLTSESFLPVLLAGRRLLWSRILHLPNHTSHRGSPSLDERMSQRS